MNGPCTLTFLGSGSAFTPPWEGNYQSNMVLTAPSGKRMLIDCGTHSPLSLHEQNLSIFDIDAIYVSHQHADHVGGLEEAALRTYYTPGAPRIKLIGNGRMLEFLWNETLKGGLSSLQGKNATLEEYFDLVPIPRNKDFVWEGMTFRTVRTVHIIDQYDLVPSFGLMFVADGKTHFITTDTQFAPNQMVDFYKMSDVVYQDCETTPYRSGVHAHYEELRTLDPAIKARMWLYHYQHGPLPDAVADGFLGFVKKGQTFDLRTG
jgi:ribonuclease BN (tRNA processing enzyme)